MSQPAAAPDAAAAAVSAVSAEDVSSVSLDESIVGSEYPDDDIRMLADALITSQGEVLADVMAGIRDALDKLNKILYNKLK
jgi:DNA-binding protein YbaB